MVLALYGGFSRLHHLRFLAREPMLTGILKVLRLPPQCTFWRFMAPLHLGIARQLLEVQRRLRERVWEAAHVQLAAVTLDTDTTVHTLFGHQMGGRKSYNPKNKGKRSYQPILTFLSETDKDPNTDRVAESQTALLVLATSAVHPLAALQEIPQKDADRPSIPSHGHEF